MDDSSKTRYLCEMGAAERQLLNEILRKKNIDPLKVSLVQVIWDGAVPVDVGWVFSK